MMREEQDRPTWDGEALAKALGRQLARCDDTVWRHELFLRWAEEEARAQAERPTRQPETLLTRGRVLRTRLLARQSAVIVVEAPAPTMPAPSCMLPLYAIDQARRAGAVACINLSAAAGSGRELWDELVEQWIPIPSELGSARSVAMRIAGHNMTPLVCDGDTVLVELGGVASIGSIVIARHPEDGYVCKRIDYIGRREMRLGSLNPEHGGVVIPRDARSIVGRVRVVWRT